MRFEDFARLHGLIIDIAYPSEKIRRCPTENKPRSDNGAYYFDGRRGWVKLWDGDGETHWWNDPDAKPWTEEEKRAWAAKKQAERERIARGWKVAAERAGNILATCTLSSHMYLTAKGLQGSLGLVTPTEELFVPMRHVDTGELVGGQMIFWVPQHTDDDGEVVKAGWMKKMMYGMNPREAVLCLGARDANETWFCEGYATGLSLQLALARLNVRARVMVCFSDHNMVAVAAKVAGKKFTFADHDKSGAGQRAAAKIGAPTAMAAREGDDANDVHQRQGLFEVCRLVMEARRKK